MLFKFLLATTIFCCSYFYSQNYDVNSIAKELRKNSNTVYRKNSTELTIYKSNDLVIKNHDVKTIFSKSGDSNAMVYIHYDKYYKISSLKVTVYDEFGKKIKSYSKSDFNDVSSTGSSGLYSDDRALVLDASQMQHPYTIDVSYQINTSNTAFIQSFTPFDGRSISTELAEYKVNNKSGVRLRKKITDNNIGKVNYSGSEDNFILTYTNIPAIPRESYSPNIHNLLPRVEFSLDEFSLTGKNGKLSTWDEFGKWYNELLIPVSTVTPEIQKEVDALNLKGSISEKVKVLYQYMQGKTRYVLVSIGIGGWQPTPADEVRKKGYGDCKGLTNYMRVLLKAAGIPSYYAIIYSDNTPRRFDENFPKMDGNHVILMVPTEKGNIWLENTSQKIAFNHIGISNSNRNVLLIKENGIEIMETPKYVAQQSQEILKLKASILDNGIIEGNADFKFVGGLYDYTLQFDGLSPDDTKDAILDRFGSSNMQNLDKIKVFNNRENAQMDISFQFNIVNHVKKMGEELFFSILPIGDPPFYLEESEDRQLPLEINFAYTDDYEIEYKLPVGYKVGSFAPQKDINTEYGKYSLKIDVEENKILIKRKFELNRMIIEKQKISEYAKFRKQARQLDNTKILLQKI